MKHDLSDTTVILPTLNESGNIERIITQLVGKYKGLRIVIADDGSTDGTINLVSEIRRRNRRVMLLDRRKKQVHGITASVIDAALITKTKNIVVMDADLQHPVNKIGQISKQLSDFDLVIGTRTRIKDMGFLRIIISRAVTFLAYLVFKVRKRRTSNDMMSGFFAIRTALFRRLIKDGRREFVGEGYKVLLDILRIAGSGTRIGQLYYSTFRKREFGESKLGIRHVCYTLISIFK